MNRTVHYLALCALVLAGTWIAFHVDAASAQALFAPTGAVGSKVVSFFKDGFQGIQWLGYGCGAVGGSACAIQAMGGRPPTSRAITITGGSFGLGSVGTIVNGILPNAGPSISN